MAREITQGQIDRFELRAVAVKGPHAFEDWWNAWCLNAPYLGRRAWLKALRDFMGPSRRQMRRRAARTRAKIVLAWLDDPHQGGRP